MQSVSSQEMSDFTHVFDDFLNNPGQLRGNHWVLWFPSKKSVFARGTNDDWSSRYWRSRRKRH